MDGRHLSVPTLHGVAHGQVVPLAPAHAVAASDLLVDSPMKERFLGVLLLERSEFIGFEEIPDYLNGHFGATMVEHFALEKTL